MTSLTQKSQVTVPKKVRLVLGLKPGDEVEFDMENGKAILIKKPKNLPFSKWKGCLGQHKTSDLMSQIR